MAITVISRAEAKAQGLSRYCTGLECSAGHMAERQTTNGVCLECRKVIYKKFANNNPDKIKEKNKRHARNPTEKRREQMRAANRRYARRNKNQIAAKGLRWRRANPDKASAIGKRWREKHRVAHLKKIREWHAANRHDPEYKAENVARAKQWMIDHPDEARALRRRIQHIRRAKMYEVGGTYTQAEIDALLEQQNYKCAAPHCAADLHEKRDLDRIVPISRGGRNDITNLQFLCPSCNRSKNDKDWEEWLAEQAATQQLYGDSNGFRCEPA